LTTGLHYRIMIDQHGKISLLIDDAYGKGCLRYEILNVGVTVKIRLFAFTSFYDSVDLIPSASIHSLDLYCM
jgi:hypothetical protein